MDEMDLAQERNERYTQECIARALARRVGPGPDMVDGVACCIECGEPIPGARLAAVPDCCRCVACQYGHEGEAA